MLLTGYSKEIFRPECRHEAESLHCIAQLNEDIGAVLPYLNAVLGGFQYTKEPPSVSFKVHGKLIAVHPRKIALNALQDEAQADKILAWLIDEINTAWDNRSTIEPRFEGAPQPKVIDILKLLPKTNCRECGQPTCMVFATQVAEGGKGPEACPRLNEDNQMKLAAYLEQFQFE